MAWATSAAAISLTLTQPPFKTSPTLTTSATTGTNTRDSINFHTFTGVTGHQETISLSPTGGQGFIPQGFVFSPSGELIGTMACPESCEANAKLAAAGTYTVVMTKGDSNDVTGTYSISAQDKN